MFSLRSAFLFSILCLGFVAPRLAYARRGYSGCCSHHGGVASCDDTVGRLMCRDGTYSPSCGCALREQPAAVAPERVVPKRAVTSKKSVRCEIGYHRMHGKCLKIVLPAHAELYGAGNDWKCVEGYTRDGGKCVSAYK